MKSIGACSIPRAAVRSAHRRYSSQGGAAFPKASSAAMTALRMDSMLAEPHATLLAARLDSSRTGPPSSGSFRERSN